MRVDFDPASLTLARPAEPGQAATTGENKAERRLREAEDAAREFETLFMDLMLKEMRKSAQPEEASNAFGIYQGMLDSEYAKALSANGGFGVQNMVLDWMKMVEPELAATAAAKGGVEGKPTGIPGELQAGKKALNQLALQQYRLQAALPVGLSSQE